MDIPYIFVYLVCISLPRVDALECYNCSNIGDLNDCVNTTHCIYGESCFLDLKHAGITPMYTLGCIGNQICGKPSSAVGELVGRDLTGRQTHDCHECCSIDNCNKHLCEHLKPSACKDEAKADCAWLNTIVNICQDIQHAKTVCPKFCGLCSLVDGNWADWSQWSTCDVTCENGTRTRTRTCTDPAPAHGGLNCTGIDIEHKGCYRQLCPVHGGWSDWGQWESCSVTCDTGIQRRHRNCSNPFPLRFGDHCFGESMDAILCMPGPCANGGWSDWGTWSSCSVTCGGGIQSKKRTCNNPRPSATGRSCGGKPTQVTSCNSNLCPLPSIIFRSKYITDLSPSAGDRLVFSKTILNDGNGYDNATGIFTAPIAGTYIFTSHLCTKPNQMFQYVLIANNMQIQTDVLRDTEYHCSTLNTVISLRQNSQVYLKCTIAGILYYESRYFWNTFTGSLMHL